MLGDTLTSFCVFYSSKPIAPSTVFQSLQISLRALPIAPSNLELGPHGLVRHTLHMSTYKDESNFH